MKLFITNFITNNNVSLENNLLKISNEIIGNLNYPSEYTKPILNDYKDGKRIYIELDEDKLIKLIKTKKLINRVPLFKLLHYYDRTINIKKKKFYKLNTSNHITYTTSDYIYILDYGFDINRNLIIKSDNIFKNHKTIYGGLLYINMQLPTNHSINKNIINIGEINKMMKIVVKYGKENLGSYPNNIIMDIIIDESISLFNYQHIIINYELLISLTEDELKLLNMINYKYIWVLIRSDLKLDRIDEKIFKILCKDDIVITNNLKKKIVEKCSYYINNITNQEVLYRNNLKWEDDLCRYIQKYSQTKCDLLGIEYIQSILYNSGLDITYKVSKNDISECEVCYTYKGCNGYISCHNGHTYCEKCFLTYYIHKKRCPICFNNSNITWLIKGDIDYYKFGKLMDYRDSVIYTNDSLLYKYLKAHNFNCSDSIIDGCNNYNESDSVINDLKFNNKYKDLVFVNSITNSEDIK